MCKVVELEVVLKCVKYDRVHALLPRLFACSRSLDLSKLLFIKNSQKIAFTIRISKSVNWLKAMKVDEKFNSFFVIVSDDEIINVVKLLARYRSRVYLCGW